MVPCILCTLLNVANYPVDVIGRGIKAKCVMVLAPFSVESKVCIVHVFGDALDLVHAATFVVLTNNKIDQEAVVKVLIFNQWCSSLSCCILFDWDTLHEAVLNCVL